MCAPERGIVASRRRLFEVFNTVPLTYLAPNLSHFVADSASIKLSIFWPFSLKCWRHGKVSITPGGYPLRNRSGSLAGRRRIMGPGGRGPLARPHGMVGSGGRGTSFLHIFPSFSSIRVSNALSSFVLPLSQPYYPSPRRFPSFLVFDREGTCIRGRAVFFCKIFGG